MRTIQQMQITLPMMRCGKRSLRKSLLENYGVTPDHYEDLGDGIYQVYVEIDGKLFLTSRWIPQPAIIMDKGKWK